MDKANREDWIVTFLVSFFFTAIMILALQFKPHPGVIPRKTYDLEQLLKRAHREQAALSDMLSRCRRLGPIRYPEMVFGVWRDYNHTVVLLQQEMARYTMGYQYANLGILEILPQPMSRNEIFKFC